MERRAVVVAGAGMVGLTLAIDLTLQGVDVLVVEKGEGLAEGSRSICQAKRTLEIWDRLGIGERIRARGVTWKLGRLFHGEAEIYAFDLLPEPGHCMPAFVNLQQFHVEATLRERLAEVGGELRLNTALVAAAARPDGVRLTLQGLEGPYELDAGWLVSCEGVRSTVRRDLGLPFEGETFQDRFLIADVRLPPDDRPPERRFWFDPPFHDGQTALLHRQADDVCRIDLQLGWDADPEAERAPERVAERIRGVLGHDDFEVLWVSLYVFQCRTLEAYVHGRVVFAGDAAHQVSPFGARGGNGGVQDADNLAWKLARVVEGRAGPRLLESYSDERVAANRENILHSTRATDFITPKSPLSRLLRDETLALARTAPFARTLIHSGRLSTPAHLRASWLNTPDDAPWATGALAPGSPAIDAPIETVAGPDWLLRRLGGGFVLLAGTAARAPRSLKLAGEPVRVLQLGRDLADPTGTLARRYDLTPGAAVLFRPDQHLCARRRRFDRAWVEAAVRRALAERAPEVAA